MDLKTILREYLISVSGDISVILLGCMSRDVCTVVVFQMGARLVIQRTAGFDRCIKLAEELSGIEDGTVKRP
jgi:hypothetical protein